MNKNIFKKLQSEKKILGIIILISVLCVNLVGAFDWNDDLQLYYDFEADTEVIDGVHNMEDNEGTGATYESTYPLIGKYGNFTTDNNNKIAANSQLNFSADFTFNLWMRSPDVSTAFAFLFSYNDLTGTLGMIGGDWFFQEEWWDGGGHHQPATPTLNDDAWYMVTMTRSNATNNVTAYINGEYSYSKIGCIIANEASGIAYIGTRQSGNDDWFGQMDEIGFWNRTLTLSEISTDLYNGGMGLGYGKQASEINLTSPANNTILSAVGTNFTANYSVSGIYNLTNATYYIYNSTGIFNNSVVVEINGTSNSTTEYIDDFILGDYEWNVYVCYTNATFNNCIFAYANYSFKIGSTLISLSYNNQTYETASETFTASFDILEGSEISLAQLVYNGTNYTISDIIISTTTFNISKTINLPLNTNPFINEIKDFFFRFTYAGDHVQETETYYQNISIINLQLCNATFNTQSINFSVKDEISKSLIDPSANNTNMQVTFKYWLGSGAEFKNYSFERLSSATNNTYEICIFPNKTFKVNMDMVYSAQAYDERTYILRNASITNVTSVIDLLLLYENLATKFTIEIRQGISILTDTTITIARFFVGEGAYRTISIRETDSAGQFVEYLDLDNDYRYSIVKNGNLLGIIDKKATCTEAPCEFTLQIAEDIGDIFEGYENNYALNVFSNLSFDLDTKTFTYDFIDITGLAQYFRLKVNRGAYNGTGVEICNQQMFSSSGSMTCNVTGYEGNFVAIGTVSRSPELITDILETTLDLLRDSLGLMAIFISFVIILTITIAGAVLSGGNPSMVLGGFGLGLLATKLMTLLPFSWGLVALFELVILIIMGWLKT